MSEVINRSLPKPGRAIVDRFLDAPAPRTPIETLEAMVANLNEGRISEFVAEFDMLFAFADHGLNLHFSESRRLMEFLEKSRELFPDTMIEIVATFQSDDAVILEWNLTATERVTYGRTTLNSPISLSGVTIAQFHKGKVTRWSEYYDQLKARRHSLASHFTRWLEY